MKITREESLPTEVVLNIECDQEDLEPYLDWSYRRVVNKVRIPGFRKGKAPRHVVESVVGREHLLHEALERAVNGLVDKALSQESIEAFSPPDVEVMEFEPLSIRAKAPLEPTVTLGDYQSLRIARKPVDVGEEQVTEVLERLRTETAPWEPVDRPIQFEDQVTIDVTGTISGETVVDSQGLEYIPSMENKLPVPGFSVMLEGSKKGDAKTFTLPVPEEEEGAIAAKECRFSVTINEVKQRALPELDDEFAKGVGDGFDDLESLKVSILENLAATAEREADEELYQQALEQVAAGATAEFSGLLVERRLDHVWHQRAQAMEAQRMDMDSYLRTVGKTEQEIRDEMRPEAEEMLERSLIVSKLSEEEGIAVTDQDVTDRIEEMVAASGSVDASFRRAVEGEGFRHSIHESLITRRTLERLGRIVQGLGLEEEPPEEETPEEEEQDKDTEAAQEGDKSDV